MARAGAVDADYDLAPEPGRDLPEGRGQHLLMFGERVEPGVPGPRSMARHSRVFRTTLPMGGNRSLSSRWEQPLPWLSTR